MKRLIATFLAVLLFASQASAGLLLNSYQLGGGGGGGGGSGNDSFTKILLHFDGTDASTTVTDDNLGGSAHTWTAGGNGQLDTAIAKFGTAAFLADGTGDYVTTPDHADFTLGAGDWTVDFWFNRAGGDGTNRYAAGQSDASGTAASTSEIAILGTSNVALGQANGPASAFSLATGTTAYTATGWHHYALVRNGSVIKLFLNGVQEGGDQAIAFTVNDSTAQFSVGRWGEFTSSTWFGSIDEFRLSVGIARWTSNFTPPAVAYN